MTLTKRDEKWLKQAGAYFYEIFDEREFRKACQRWRAAFEKYFHLVPKEEAKNVICYWVFGVAGKDGQIKYKRKHWLVGDRKLIRRSMKEISDSL